MPRGLSEKSLNEYKEVLHIAHSRWEAEAKPIIERMNLYFRGQQWPKVENIRSIPPHVVNFILSDIKVMLPALSLRSPRVFCKPTQATMILPDGRVAMMIKDQNGQDVPVPVIEAAKAKETLINWRWRELRIKQQVRRTLQDSLLAPFGVMKIGYTLETEKVSLGGAEGDDALIESNELIKSNAPFAVRWSPSAFRVDSEARYPDLSDAGFVAFGWKARLDDVKRNPRFKNTRNVPTTVELKTDFKTTGAESPSRSRPSGALEEHFYQRVQLWELWDKRRQKRIVLADDHDKELEYVDWPEAYENFPAETLYFTEHPDQLYGPPDLYQVLYQQDGYNQTTALIINHIRRSLRKYLVQTGTMDEKEKQKFEEPIDMLLIEVMAQNVGEAVQPLKDANIPADWWVGRQSLRDDHDRVSAMSDFARGIAEKVDTAAEAGIVQSHLSVRTNDSRDFVEDFAARISRQLLQIDAQTFDPESMIPVVGPDGALALGQFAQVQSRAQLQAETDVEVQIGSMQPENLARRKQDILQLYAILRGDPMVDQFELREQLSHAYKDSIPDIDQLFLTREQFQQVMQNLQRLQGPPVPPAGNGGPPAPAMAPPSAPMGAPGAPQPVPPRVF